jgi:hypothetical protein
MKPISGEHCKVINYERKKAQTEAIKAWIKSIERKYSLQDSRSSIATHIINRFSNID